MYFTHLLAVFLFKKEKHVRYLTHHTGENFQIEKLFLEFYKYEMKLYIHSAIGWKIKF